MVEYFVHGVRLRIDSTWSRFLRYLALNLNAFSPSAPTTHELLVNAVIHRKPWVPPRPVDPTAPEGAERWGDDLMIRDGTARFRWGSLSVEVSFGPPATVHALYVLDRKTRVAGAFREVPRWEDVQAVVRFAVYLPLFHLLEGSGAIVLHAGAVAGPEGAIVLAGLNGSGKSTLCSSLIDRLSYMSDNYVIWTRERILGFPEALRLPESAAADSAANPSVWGKRLVPPDPRRVVLAAKPRALVFLTLGARTLLRALPAAEAARRLDVIQDMTAEFPRYGYLGPLAPPRDPEAIPSLARAVPSYALAVKDTATARAEILRLANGDA